MASKRKRWYLLTYDVVCKKRLQRIRRYLDAIWMYGKGMDHFATTMRPSSASMSTAKKGLIETVVNTGRAIFWKK